MHNSPKSTLRFVLNAGILQWGRLLLAGWWSLDVACVMSVLCLCRSCRGQATFGEIAVGGILSSSPGFGSPRWSRQPAAGAAGPSGRAGLLILAPWRFGQSRSSYLRAGSTALGVPQKSSPQQAQSMIQANHCPPPRPRIPTLLCMIQANHKTKRLGKTEHN
jgi:hypothetical protein